ncbi:flagellar hook-length control protein FliK [Pseudobutyrivibrio sp. AR14]|uniref:flagellar hook-length control protein FliK n=1 Tax=Pseudobutyrivibrio sp. AR14 TaxID=1520804 RepID=UPI0008917922|nr:flagellar hook-length control protein FliK [Pseudobutyrivibrio sp. AR14]SCX85681.1 flagellar hook-length control protein FliK [Pseudobutyrivibrio sp. AR14]
MTSSNVSNLLIQVSQIDMSAVNDKMTVSKDKGLFEDTLKNVAGSGNPVDIKRAEPTKNTLDNKPFESGAIAKSVADRPENGQTADSSRVVEKVEAVAEEIKDVIKDELDITDEELEKAMETLGLTILDLFNPQSLAQLVTEITGETDSVALLMNDSFKNILDNVSTLTNQLLDDLKISFEEVKEIVLPELKSENLEINEELVKGDLPTENPSKLEEVLDDNQNLNPVEPQVVLTEQIKPMEGENVKPQQNIQMDINDPVEMKPQVDDNNNSSKQEFDFSKNAKTANDTPKVTHEATVVHENLAVGQQEAAIEYSVEQEVVTLPTGETVRAESIVNQLVEQAKVLTDAESTTMEMTLNPEGLGKIFMEVTQKGDVITAKIFTENDAVKQALENQMATLRTELNQNSTKVTSIEVSVGAHEFERNLEQNAKDESRREEQMSKQSSKRNSRINLNSLDELSGIMSEEDMLIAQMMKDNGNTLDFQA